jgi:exonuclease III
MQVKRIKNNLHIGTLNVLTLREPGKMQELAEQVKETRIEILAVQETRWLATGIINKKDYTMYYSRTRGKTVMG